MVPSALILLSLTFINLRRYMIMKILANVILRSFV